MCIYLRVGSLRSSSLIKDLPIFVVISVWQNRNIDLNGPMTQFIPLSLKVIHFGHNKQMMLQIRDYIQAKDRNAVFESEPIVIRHLPTIFKLAKNREILVKKINKLIYSP